MVKENQTPNNLGPCWRDAPSQLFRGLRRRQPRQLPFTREASNPHVRPAPVGTKHILPHLYIKSSYHGSKDHLDACGRPRSSPLQYAIWAYGAAQLDTWDAMPADDKARHWPELQGYQPLANPRFQAYPDQHPLEAGHVNMLTRH